jgi:glycosyltransferase involved in cell wall biosynthesis
MNATARISVIVPLYNAGWHVEDTIASALDAIPKVHEVVVVYSGASDAGAQRAAQLRERFDDARLAFIRQPSRSVVAARNLGVRAATGEFVAFLDAGDTWLPNYVPQIQILIRTFPECDIFATYHLAVADDEEAGTPPLYELPGHDESRRLASAFDAWHNKKLFDTCSAVIRRSALQENGIAFADESDDLAVWLGLSKASCRVAYNARPLVAQRVSGADTTHDDATPESKGVWRFLERLDRAVHALASHTY